MGKYYTSESVTSGHPDKLADLIADSILDECLKEDPESHVACEVMLAHNKCFLSGEISTSAEVNYIKIAKEVIKKVGYPTDGIEFESRIHEQSPDINQAVSKENQGAGDQGIVYGYAIKETKELMPLEIVLAHKLAERLEYARKTGQIKGFLPDGKTQVTTEVINGKKYIKTIIVSAQHEEYKTNEEIRADIINKVITPALPAYAIKNAELLINPSGRFVEGGFEADTGLTGRKLIVDTYGGRAHFGGGAMSGKDASKVDRSGAYLARYIAKNVVAAGLAYEAEVSLSYAIGVPNPTSCSLNTFGTGIISDEEILKAINKVFDLSVKGSIKNLDLKLPIFKDTAVYGHFGKEYLPWEKTDKVKELLSAIDNS